MKKYVIGVDYGSDSARAVVIDAADGRELAEDTAYYRRWRAGLYQDPARRMFRQHPLDYTEALEQCVRGVLNKAGEEARASVVAIAVDTTGSTPCPVDADGTPLALKPEFAEEPDAMFHLWKDHVAIDEANEITEVFRQNADGVDYTRSQGPYASEWFWAKMLHVARTNPAVRDAAYTWVEHSDWMPALLTGRTRPAELCRCACAAGHKGYWHSAWGGLPSAACLGALHPYLAGIRGTYPAAPTGAGEPIGTLTREWADRLGLSTEVVVAGSTLDAHAGAVGAGVNRETMVINLGTSAVNLCVAPMDALQGKNIGWIANAAENSIIPGYIGIESGQSSFGDVYAWLSKLLLWPVKALLGGEGEALLDDLSARLLPALQAEAEKLDPEDVPSALDWLNGRRYPNVNESVQSALMGLNMGTGAPAIYHALTQAIVFGQRRIVDALAEQGVRPPRIVAVGGIARKSSFLMQMLADALGKPIEVSRSNQACARGAAIFAAVAAGCYSDVETAQRSMCEGTVRTYRPGEAGAARYEKAYRRYLDLADYMDGATVSERAL